MPLISMLFIGLGVLYIVKPNLYRRWFWKKTDIFQQKLSEKNYNLMMRILGAALIIIALFVWLLNRKFLS